MFGKNPIRSLDDNPNHLAVESHFYTIQGEGPFSGLPALFIRLSGCNLACHFCDTQFEEQADKPKALDDLTAELLSQYSYNQRAFVVITGGEPMRQNFSRLAAWLYLNGTKIIQVETAGTLWQPDLDVHLKNERMVLVCSPKTPKVHPMVIRYCRHWKYIITAGEISANDGLPVRGTQCSTKDKEVVLYRQPDRRPIPGLGSSMPDTTWVSPCDSYDPEQNQRNLKAAVSSSMIFGHRLSLQVHKIAGVE
jgi:7-carboxy-7-deazaguanine synthase